MIKQGRERAQLRIQHIVDINRCFTNKMEHHALDNFAQSVSYDNEAVPAMRVLSGPLGFADAATERWLTCLD